MTGATLRATADAIEPARDLPLLVVRRDEGAVTIAHISRTRRAFRVLRFVPLIMLLVMAGGLIGLYFQPPGLRKVMALLSLQPGGGTSNPIAVPVERKPSPPATPHLVVGLGRLLPEGEVVTVATPFGAGDARIAALNVSEGQFVAQGELLAVLDNERQLLAAVDYARAGAASREAALVQTRAAVAASRDEASAALGRAEASADNAERELERVEELRRKGYAADQTYEQRRTARDESRREVERLRATLSRYAGDAEAQADIVLAMRTLDAARAELRRAEAELEKAYVRAPLGATIIAVNARPGEKPGAQGIFKLGAIDRMKAEIEIYQSLIGKVAIGDRVEIRAEALPRPLSGTVERIGLEVARQTATDPSPAANTDARVVKVHAALDPESAMLARRYTNLQVTARIAVRNEP